MPNYQFLYIDILFIFNPPKSKAKGNDRWLKISGIVGKEKVNTVWLSQKAKMKMKPEQENWNHARAEQCFVIKKPAFV